MLKKWLYNLLPHSKNTLSKESHRIAVNLNISSKAAKQILEQLNQAGYQAYIVGGAIRDLLLGIHPKDFDIATNATPEQIHRIFRRSRIIGRRFQIVHVMIGNETIEVSTFRSGKKVRQNKQGRIMQDNTYGTIEQDAMRRDFTCNALYYNYQHQEIIDYHNGIEDTQQRRLVMIGNPSERYQEDPVRILRAIRLAGKLGFQVAHHTAEPIPHYAHLLAQEPPARLFDELLKILFSGNAIGCLKKINQLGITKPIHPLLSVMQVAGQNNTHLATQALEQTDYRIKNGKKVSIGFILAALFWQKVETYWQQHQEHNSPAAAMINAVQQIKYHLETDCGIPQRFSATMREIWLLQPQFSQQKGSRPFKLLNRSRFRAAYDFLVLRAKIQPQLQPLAQWWEKFQHAEKNNKQEMIKQLHHQSTNTNHKRKKNPQNDSIDHQNKQCIT